MEQKILDLLRRSQSALNSFEIARRLNIPSHKAKDLQKSLASLERAGRIARIKQGDRYALPDEADLISGRIRLTRSGAGYLEPADPAIPDIKIPPDGTSTALHGDRVLVRRDVDAPLRGARQHEPSGRVVRVLESARTQIVGTLQTGRNLLYVIPDDPRMQQDVYVPAPHDVGRAARPGDKVVVELREWKSRHANPEGEIIEVLGPPDAEGVDMLSVIRQYNLPLHFPNKVLQEARSHGSEVKPSEFSGRVDCRSHQVITIDPDDAKDFDDAICLQRAERGEWKLWVHIADVSHYVKTGTLLDREAAKRGNSTYLVDRVIPMLPEILSNELCSLKPGVPRLTKCVEFTLSKAGEVLHTEFYSAIIHSQQRFTYGEVIEVLQRPAKSDIETMLHDANALAQVVRRARFKAGSLDLDFPESKIRLDVQGKVVRIEKIENDISHQLIEEFMLLANEAVAARLMQLNRQTLYRIHEPPDPKRLEEYREEVLSHHVACGNLSNRREVQKLLQTLSRLPIGLALKIGFLRSLMRARYAVEPLGHYGLAKKKYTHFTSPIRRYADLIVHRSLFSKSGQKVADAPLVEVADRISQTERNSDDAERDSRDVKLFAYLELQLKSGNPDRYSGLVTDVRNFGFFVDVGALGMSGLVPLSGLSDDFYRFEVTRGELAGRRSGRVIRLGQRLDVVVAKVDRFKKQVDFKLAPNAAREKGTFESSRQGQARLRNSGFRGTIQRAPKIPRRR